MPTNARSKEFVLRPASPGQIKRTWVNSYDEWGKGVLSQEEFYRREECLASQDFAKNALTVWAFTPKDEAGTLDMLSHLETFERPILVRPKGQKALVEARCFSIGTVFCPRERRGNGYASKMMSAIAEKFANEKAFSNLYSDIGPEFYSRHGWKTYSPVSFIVSVPDSMDKCKELGSGADVVLLSEEDIPKLAKRDCEDVRSHVEGLPISNVATRVAVLPEATVYPWFFARAHFEYKSVFGKDLDAPVGASVSASGSSSFIVWTYDCRKKSIVILRSAVRSSEDMVVLTRRAIECAVELGFTSIEFWNPPFENELVGLGARREIRTKSLPGLFVPKLGDEDSESVEWLINEKYPWV